jgi:rhamnosyltransferase
MLATTMEIKVCGTVILFNPDITILDNIRSYLNQVELLIVIDNSEDGNSEIIDKIKLFKSVDYKSFNENLGVAKALNVAANIAIQRGFQYLLTMDQDSKAPSNMVDLLLKARNELENVGIISPLHANRFGTHLNFTERIQKVIITITSGNLLSLDVYKKLGGFTEEYFIDYVDVEYCFRLYCNNYYIIQLNDVILDHNEADLSEVQIFWKKIHPHNHKPFRLYYKTRNLLYLRNKYKNIVPYQMMRIEYDSYLRTIARMILFEKYKLKKLMMVFLGIWDYFTNKKGKRF